MAQTNELKAIRTLFYIQNKEGTKVQFIPNGAQRFLDQNDNPTGRLRIIIAKARQKGFSRGLLAKFAIRCLGREGTHAVVISHEAGATTRLLDSVHYFLKHINGPKPEFGRNSRAELYFPLRESTYYVGTAGARAFGRGDWITDLHCSEYAWWEDAVKHTAGLFQAVPHNGRIYLESTGNGRNNDFFYIWDNADAMGYTRLFYPWFADSEYELDLPASMTYWRPDLPRFASYMLDMQQKFKLADRKMFWYESKLKEMREDMKAMQQEYPFEPDECFQATGGAVFNNVTLSVDIERWIVTRFSIWHVFQLQGHPNPKLNYVIGGDPSGGTGGDDAAIQVMCCETGEQVFELFYNTINPIEFAKLMCEVGTYFNMAFLVSESNNHGAAVIPYLKENYPRDKIYKRKFATKTTPAEYGWNNGRPTKHALVGIMQEDLGQVKLYGMQTVKELKAFEEVDDKMTGKEDNLVIATGLAMLGLRKFHYLREEYEKAKPPVLPKIKPDYTVTTLDEIIANIDKRRQALNGFYGKQTGEGYPNA